LRGIVYRKHGGVDQLEEVDLPEPKMAPNRVLVEVHSIGLNPLDYRIRNGEMGPLASVMGPRLIGSDFAGRVLQTGTAVRDLVAGDRVYGMVFQPRTGTSAERITVKRTALTRSPRNLSDSAAAMVPLAAQTAYQALHHIAQLHEGQRVLINGASGGVGTFALQLAKIAGAHVTAVTSHRNTDWVTELGADETIDYTEADCCSGDAQYDVFFDCYGNRSFKKASRVLTAAGVYISTIPGPRTYSWSLGNAFRRQKSHVVVVRNRMGDLSAIRELIEEGRLRPIVDTVYSRDQIKTAYEALETKRTKGKIAVQMRATRPASPR
jgi:2-desacetyl-2-hydroxyethyl bacteriochlorophyllide A dehydrogenase